MVKHESVPPCSMGRGGISLFHLSSNMFMSVPHRSSAKHGTVFLVPVCSVLSSVPNTPWRNWNGIWPCVWSEGIQFLHLSQWMMNSLNCGIQRIPSSSSREPNITKEFVIQILLNFANQTTPNFIELEFIERIWLWMNCNGIWPYVWLSRNSMEFKG